MNKLIQVRRGSPDPAGAPTAGLRRHQETSGPRRGRGRETRAQLACVAGAILLLLAPTVATAAEPATAETTAKFPAELVQFTPYEGNPVFAGTDRDTWDRKIRERGYILREGGLWRLWYTGYNTERSDLRKLGYATSPDGLRWTRSAENPIFDRSWVEDMCVVHHGDTYTMFAEGRNDIAHMLTSSDGIHWQDQGNLDIRTTDGKPLSPGPYGTPTVWVEGDVWNLFYERGDRGVWLARSTDRRTWTNVQDQPVIARGPEAYDRSAVALNQVIRVGGRYYGYYHANADPQWKGPWTTCVATSTDLVHWEKYAKNPIIRSNDSSAMVLPDGNRWRLYTMHPAVKVWFSRKEGEK